MKDYKIHTADGVRDFLPNTQRVKSEIERQIKKVFYQYGYEPITTPTFEYAEVFDEEDGNISRQEMYQFLDRKGNLLTLRPDLTPPIGRVVATSYRDAIFPLRLCYVGNTYRYVDGYTAKMHEFTQAGVELIGNSSIGADSEVIVVAISSLLAAGLTDFSIHIGQVDLFNVLMECGNVSKEYINLISMAIENKNIVTLEKLVKEAITEEQIARLVIELPFLCGKKEVLKRITSLTNNERVLSVVHYLDELVSILSFYGLDSHCSFDLGMVGQFEYYTGVIFKGYASGSGASICDGGRYDNLIEKFGNKKDAVGFAINIYEILTVLSRKKIVVNGWKINSYILAKFNNKHAITLADGLRKQGYFIENGIISLDLEENLQLCAIKNIPELLYVQEDGNILAIDVVTRLEKQMTVEQCLLERKNG